MAKVVGCCRRGTKCGCLGFYWLLLAFLVLAFLFFHDRGELDNFPGHQAREEAWPATNWIALFYRYHIAIMQQPDMKAFYIEEGKWVDYLAKRIPGYLD